MIDPSLLRAKQAARALADADPQFTPSFTPVVSADVGRLMLALGSGDSVQQFAEWAALLRPLQTCPLEGLHKRAAEVTGTGKLVVVVETGRSWSTHEVDVCSLVALPRPVESVAFIMAGAERVSGKEELEDILRVARRVLGLVPGRAPAIYFWSSSAMGDEVGQRLSEDLRHIQSWLATPLTDLTALQASSSELASLLAQQVAAVTASATPEPRGHLPQNSLRLHLLQGLAGSVDSMRDELLGIWDRECARMSTDIKAMLSGVEGGMRTRFMQAASTHAQWDDACQQDVQRACQHEWQTHVPEVVKFCTERVDLLLQRVKSTLEVADWSAFNELDSKRPAQPHSVLKQVRGSISNSLEQDASFRIAAANLQRGKPSVSMGTLIGVAVGSICTLAFVTLPFLWGAGLVGAGALVGQQLYARRSNGQSRQKIIQDSLAQVMAQLREVEAGAISSASAHLQCGRQTLEKSLLQVRADINDAIRIESNA